MTLLWSTILLISFKWNVIHGQDWENFQRKHIVEGVLGVPQGREDCVRFLEERLSEKEKNERSAHSLIFAKKDDVLGDFDRQSLFTKQESKNSRVICIITNIKNRPNYNVELCRNVIYEVTIEPEKKTNNEVGEPVHYDGNTKKRNCKPFGNTRDNSRFPIFYNPFKMPTQPTYTSGYSNNTTSVETTNNNYENNGTSASSSETSNDIDNSNSVD